MSDKPGPERTALVVGVSGQDGAYLSKLLLGKGYTVVGTSRDAQEPRMGNLSRLGILGQVHSESMIPTDFRSVVEVLAKWRPDEVYNLSGQSSVAMSFTQPVEALNSIANATITLLDAIRFLAKPIRFYNAGSSECFGEVLGLANESTPFHPRSPYAAAKAAAHWIVANYRDAYQLYACTGILFNHESPLRHARFVTRKIVIAAAEIAAGRQDRLVLGNMGVKRDWGWAPEYVEAMWLMLQQESPKDFVIATGRVSALEEFVATAFSAVGLDWRKFVVSDPALIRPSDLEGFAGDGALAARELGWRPTVVMPEIARIMVLEELRQARVGAVASA